MLEVLEVGCDTCTAVCCQDVILALYAEEVARSETAGGQIRTLLPIIYSLEIGDDPKVVADPNFSWADEVDTLLKLGLKYQGNNQQLMEYWFRTADHAKTMKAGQGLFAMLGRCAFLGEDNLCTVYENRFEICQEFELGGKACINLRGKAGLPVPVQIGTAS